jgi:hypothetical protein
LTALTDCLFKGDCVFSEVEIEFLNVIYRNVRLQRIKMQNYKESKNEMQ